MQQSFDDVIPGLFGGNEQPDSAHVGYKGQAACSIAGITYRQLDYWARTGLVVPSIKDATGSGSQRLYSFKDLLILKIVKRLLDAGISLQNIRVAVEQLRARGTHDLAKTTLICDGTTVYECTSAEEIVDLLRGGQGVFGLAVGVAADEVSGNLAQFPSFDTSAATTVEHPEDELSKRRARGVARSA